MKKRRRIVLIASIVTTLLIVAFFLLQPQISYNGRVIGLAELNKIRAAGGATYCVQQVNAFSYHVGMSFLYSCFDSQAEADKNIQAVQTQVKALDESR